MMTMMLIALVAIVALAVVETMINRPPFAAGVVLSAVAVAALSSGTMPDVIVAGFTITVSDVVFSLVVAAGVARSLRLSLGSGVRRLLLLIIVLTLIALVRGAQIYGPDAAVREFRTFFYFFGGAFYFSTVRPDSEVLDRIVRVWIAVSVVLVCIAAMRWIAVATGMPLMGVLARDREIGSLRVIDSRSTLIIAQTLVLLLPLVLRRQAGRCHARLFVVLIPVLAVLQHRTIWLVLILGCVIVLRRSRLLTTEQLVVLVGAGIVVIGLLLANPAYEGSGLVERSPVDTGSLDWRWNSWMALIADETSSTEWVGGTPFGSGFERELYGVTVTIIPHNWYVEILYRLGVLGLVPFVALYAIVVKRWHIRRTDPCRLLTRHTMYVLSLIHI